MCLACPGECDWSSHSVVPYKWENISKEPHLMENELLTAKEAVKKLKNDISETKKSVKESEVIVSRCIQELEQIALCPTPLMAQQSVELWMREANARLPSPESRNAEKSSASRKSRSTC